MGGGGPERVRERTEGVRVFVDGTWTGGATGTVPVLSDVLGMSFTVRRWIGVLAAVGPVFLGAFDGVGINYFGEFFGGKGAGLINDLASDARHELLPCKRRSLRKSWFDD